MAPRWQCGLDEPGHFDTHYGVRLESPPGLVQNTVEILVEIHPQCLLGRVLG
jgi:hypothetical protein